jgi:hypothetical protein
MKLHMVRILTIRDLRSNLAKFIYNFLVPRTFFPLEAGHFSVIAARHWNFYFSRHKHKTTHVVDNLRMKVSKHSITEGYLNRMNKLRAFREIGGVLFCSIKEKILIFPGCSLKSLDISSSVVDPGASAFIMSDLGLPENLAMPVLVSGMFRISAHTDNIFVGSEPQCGVARKKIAAVEVRILE